MRTTVAKLARVSPIAFPGAGKQRGFLLIAAVVLIVVAALLLTVMVFMGVTATESGVGHSQSGKALFIAESGVERALYGFSKEGAACASLTYTASIGEGGFSTTGALYAPAATALSAAISATDTIIPVVSIAFYAPHGRLTIGAESVNYTGSSATSCGAFGAPCLTGATRGAGGSVAAAHALGAAVTQNQCLIHSVGTVGTANRTVERAVSAAASSTSAIIVYAKETSPGIPFYRFWDNTTATWGAEQSASSVGGGGRLIQYIVVKSARTRNEMILGTLDSTGDIRIQIWNGSNWSDGTTVGATRLMADVGTTNDNYRGFDIAYETGNDRAMVVYNNNTRNPAYQIWDGSSWVTGTLNGDLGGNYTANNNPPIWIDLAADPRSGMNNMVLLTMDNARGVYGVTWDGVTWTRRSTNALWGQTAVVDRKPMDVAYEQVSGRAMFAWGTTNSSLNQQRYRIWNSSTSTLSGIIDLDITTMNSTANWIRLVAEPNTNNLMYGVQDSSPDLHTLFWNGTTSTFGFQTRHDTRTEAGASRNFDMAFETFPANAGQAWLVWGTASGSDQVRQRHWNGGWDPVLPKIGDDTGYIRVAAHPVTGAIFTAIYQTNGSAARDIQEVHLTNGSGTWSGISTIWNGGTAGNPVMQRVDVTSARGGLALYDWIEVFP